FKTGQGNGPIGLYGSTAGRQTLAKLIDLDGTVMNLFAPTFYQPANGTAQILAVSNGLYNVNYTYLQNPKVPLTGLSNALPIMAAGYTFQALPEWGSRRAVGELQTIINQMVQQEAQVASAIGAWDALQGAILREVRLINAKLDTAANIRLKNEVFSRLK